MALCKPDLVAAVLKELGHEAPDPEELTKAVFDASARLKEEHGLNVKDCLMMTPVSADRYAGGLREDRGLRGKESIHI